MNKSSHSSVSLGQLVSIFTRLCKWLDSKQQCLRLQYVNIKERENGQNREQ